ncbi:hypothetical protein AOQ84DRAFT_390552 [Glonium stellatum]|uniref:Zn(2)-C6 fungal-type domain-containing protein n=1 Tax=Glonium stellatum TaxID=574774 RepID=A0A8E2JR12_9PEZI|nr:hypothetical protein AOQ84DRAFT_390552 [Glonium stellatum]
MTQTPIQGLTHAPQVHASTSLAPEDIVVWLNKLDPRDAPPAIDSVEDQGLSSGAPRQDYCSSALPCALQHHDTLQSCTGERPSPTNTNFTDNSIFDQPLAPDTRYFNSRDNELLSSFSTASIASSDCSNSDRSGRPRIDHSGSLVGTEPQNVTAVEVADAHDIGQSYIAPEHHTIIWVTSCLQCALAKLPCSRKIPACSRCVRSGFGELCLLQRRKLNPERVWGDVVGNMMPVLLQEEGQNAEIAERKRALNAKLLENHKHDMDRKNWVLPINDGNLSGFRPRENRRLFVQIHPGEGIGRAIPQMVHLA